MMTLDDFMTDQMKDPEFAKAYEEIQPEMSVILAIVCKFRSIGALITK